MKLTTKNLHPIRAYQRGDLSRATPMSLKFYATCRTKISGAQGLGSTEDKRSTYRRIDQRQCRRGSRRFFEFLRAAVRIGRRPVKHGRSSLRLGGDQTDRPCDGPIADLARPTRPRLFARLETPSGLSPRTVEVRNIPLEKYVASTIPRREEHPRYCHRPGRDMATRCYRRRFDVVNLSRYTLPTRE